MTETPPAAAARDARPKPRAIDEPPQVRVAIQQFVSGEGEELAQHTTSESCWVVIRGHVYDVTRFHHPGGNDRLFELAGDPRELLQRCAAVGELQCAVQCLLVVQELHGREECE